MGAKSADSGGGKAKGLLIVAVSYLLALAAAWLAGDWYAGMRGLDMPDASTLLVADVAGTLVIFAFSVLYSNSSFYDPYWSVMPMAAAAWLWWHPAAGAMSTDPWSLILLILVWAYGFRLTFNWARGWTGLDHEDWRYVDLQKKTGKAYWIVSFLGIHFFPTVLTYLGSLPMLPAFGANVDVGLGLAGGPSTLWLAIPGALILLTGIVMEATADQQLHNFRKTNTDPTRILDTGVWRYSRHPNYFGEICVWWGIAFFGAAALPSSTWNWVGAISITCLFVFISIPMIDDRMRARRPAYAERQRRVSAFIPMPPKED
jgi:steroid 5-alpha reductase family enzyme